MLPERHHLPTRDQDQGQDRGQGYPQTRHCVRSEKRGGSEGDIYITVEHHETGYHATKETKRKRDVIANIMGLKEQAGYNEPKGEEDANT